MAMPPRRTSTAAALPRPPSVTGGTLAAVASRTSGAVAVRPWLDGGRDGVKALVAGSDAPRSTGPAVPVPMSRLAGTPPVCGWGVGTAAAAVSVAAPVAPPGVVASDVDEGPLKASENVEPTGAPGAT